MKNKRTLFTVIGLLTLAVLILSVIFIFIPTEESNATFKTSEAVQLKDPSGIENATLIIGTHLIHLSALTDELYEIALTTATDSDQQNMYYKSELADGAWFEISNISGVLEITEHGTPVDDSEISSLYVRWHTKSDKITYDLLTGEETNIFDTLNGYDMYERAENAQVRSIYDGYAEREAMTDSDWWNSACLTKFFKVSLHNSNTDIYDTQMNGLQTYYEKLADSDEESSRLGKVTYVMSIVNAQRELEILDIIEYNLGLLQDYVQGKAPEGYGDATTIYPLFYYEKNDATVTGIMNSISWEDEDDHYIDEYIQDSSLVQNIAYSLMSVEENKVEPSSKALADGDLILDHEAYKNYLNIITYTGEGNVNYEICDNSVTKLIHLDNIGLSAVSDKEEELLYLSGKSDNVTDYFNEDFVETDNYKNSLFILARTRYRDLVSAGASSEYKATIGNTSITASERTKILKNQLSVCQTELSELELIIDNIVLRVTADSALDFVDAELEATYLLRDSGYYLKEDVFKEYALQSVNDYIVYLEKTKADILAGSTGSEIDELLAEKDEYLVEQLSCLDDNDLAGAAKYESLISELDKKIDELGGASAGNIADLYTDALEALTDGDTDALDNSVNGLNELGSASPKAGIKALENLSEAIDEYVDAFKAAHGDEEISATDAELISALEYTSNNIQLMISDLEDCLGNSLNMDDLLKIIANHYGKDAYSLDSSDAISAIIALDNYGYDYNDDNALDLAKYLAEYYKNKKNKYIYEQLKNPSSPEYISAKTIGLVSGYRYVYDNSKKLVDLAKGSRDYKYTAFSSDMTFNGSLVEMDYEAKYQSTIYLHEDYCNDTFGLTAEYLEKSDLAVCATAEMLNEALELYDKFLSRLSLVM